MPDSATPRAVLDVFAAAARLDEAGRSRLLELGHALPDAAHWRRALRGACVVAGVISLGLGLVFFIAANWSAMGVGARLLLVQAVLVVAAAAALWRPPPSGTGRGALLLAFVSAGALLALFGQTFQTGADVYELFVAWALLGLPFVLAGRWSAISAAWLLVVNLALGLLCDVVPGRFPMWAILRLSDDSFALRLTLAMLPNLALWIAAEAGHGRSRIVEELLPLWLRRLVVLVGLGFGTVGASYAILDESALGVSLVLPLCVAAGIAAYVLRRDADPMPLVAACASLVVLGMVALAKVGDGEEILFLMAAWLLVGSGASALWLLPRIRRWEADHDAR